MNILSWNNRFEWLRRTGWQFRNRIWNLLHQPGILKAGLRQRITIKCIPRLLKTTRSLAPWGVNFYPDFSCPYHCPYCSNHWVIKAISEGRLPENWKDPMPPALFGKILRELVPSKPVIGIIGGEPLLYIHIEQMLHMIISMGFHCSFTTNGYALEQFAPFLVEQGLPVLGVSYDGPREVTDRISGHKGSWKRNVAGIEALLAARRRLGRKKPLLKLILTICPENQHHILNTFLEMQRLGPDVISVRHYLCTTPEAIAKMPDSLLGRRCGLTVPFGGETAIAGFSRFDALSITGQLKECASIANRSKTHFIIEPSMTYQDTLDYYGDGSWTCRDHPCWVPWNIMDIMPNGDAVFCGFHFMTPFGNLAEQSFSEVWNGIAIRDIRRHLLDKSPFPICERCCGTFAEF